MEQILQPGESFLLTLWQRDSTHTAHRRLTTYRYKARAVKALTGADWVLSAGNCASVFSVLQLIAGWATARLF
jgi:hypothetical protein